MPRTTLDRKKENSPRAKKSSCHQKISADKSGSAEKRTVEENIVPLKTYAFRKEAKLVAKGGG